MGLNPPFGVQASLANQFIAKALQFKPKLLILIVPQETKRLDKKNPRYDLIWEDKEIVAGKSFYLPGSVDVHNQQMEQWNLDPPPLYLWSRPDWTAKHKAIALNQGHLSKEQEETQAKAKDVQRHVSNYLMEENHDCYGDFSNIMSSYGDISRILDDVPEDFDDMEHGGRAIVSREQYDYRNNLPSYVSNKMQNETSQLGELDFRESLRLNEMCVDMELSTPTNSLGKITGLGSFSEYQPNAANETRAAVAADGQEFRDLQPRHSGFPYTHVDVTGSGWLAE